MKRMFGAVVVGLVAVAAAQAHFAFIVPGPDGNTARLVFSDELAPDTKVNIEKLANTKLTLRDARKTDTPLEWTKGDGFYEVKVPGSGPRVVYGVTEYGVLQKGDSKPFRLTYYPKALLGDTPRETSAIGTLTIGAPLKVEIIPRFDLGKVRFQVIHDTTPAAGAEVTVLVPGSEKKSVTTDKEGFTPAFEATGRYGVSARVTEAKGGEYAGQKYEEARHYATLVVDVGK
jgi:uncharacterized GH25 family protein